MNESLKMKRRNFNIRSCWSQQNTFILSALTSFKKYTVHFAIYKIAKAKDRSIHIRFKLHKKRNTCHISWLYVKKFWHWARSRLCQALATHIQRYLHNLAQLNFGAPFNVRHHFETLKRSKWNIAPFYNCLKTVFHWNCVK